MYVVADPAGRDFRAFLDSHSRLLQRLHRWAIWLAVPTASLDCQALHTSILTQFASAPLRPRVAEEFQWFSHARRAVDDGTRSALPLDAARFTAARRALGAPRFYAAYRARRTGGDSVIHELLSARLHDACTRGDGRVQTYVLPHQYERLAPVVATA